MSERRRGPVRPVVGLVLLVLGLVEIQGVVQTVRAQTRLRARVITGIERPVISTWTEIASALRSGGPARWREALAILRPRTAASELEVMPPNVTALVEGALICAKLAAESFLAVYKVSSRLTSSCQLRDLTVTLLVLHGQGSCILFWGHAHGVR